MIARRIATAVATVLAALAPLPVTGARASDREVEAAARTETGVRNLPSTFRLPPGSEVAGLSDQASGATFTLTAPPPEAVLSFYRRQLPLGAFTIVADRTDHDATSLSFRHAEGWAGQIYATAHRVTVAVKRA